MPRLTTASMDSGELRIWTALNSPESSPPIAGELFATEASVNEIFPPSPAPSAHLPIAGEFFAIAAAVNKYITDNTAAPLVGPPTPTAGGPLPPSPIPPPTPIPIPIPSLGSDYGPIGGSSTGATVGIIVGVLGALLFVALVSAGLLKKKYPKSKLWSCFGYCQFFLSTNNSNNVHLESHKTYLSPPPAPEVGGTRGETTPEVSKVFTYKELKEATKGFAAANLLGEGGFGRVYEGRIAGNLVAVKQLKIGGGQGEREFRAEVEIISRVHHRHLVSLVGYCISDTHRLLVYKYVPNGTLEQALHDPTIKCMAWATRINVALGTARGLAYLHEDCHPRIIHRDIKGSNILLDNQWEAQVSDFGLAKLADDLQTHVTTRVMGTFGYVAPEYAMSGKLTDKSDVYSFGVVLLELITGKRPVDKTLPGADGEESLVEWARPLLTKALETENVDAVADPNLKHNYDKKEMFRMVEVAAACVRHSSHMRPKMVEALRILAAQNADLHQGVLPGYSGALARVESEEHMRKFRQLVYISSTSRSSIGDSKGDSGVQLASSGEFGSSHLAPAMSSKEIV